MTTAITNQEINNKQPFSTIKKYAIESGLGGTFSLIFLKKEHNLFHFQVTNKDHEHVKKLTQMQALSEVWEIY